MTNRRSWQWAIPLVLLAAPTLAANKCVEASGRIFYQAAPCPPNTRGGDMSLNVNRPFTGQARRPALTDATAVAPKPAVAPADREPDPSATQQQDVNY